MFGHAMQQLLLAQASYPLAHVDRVYELARVDTEENSSLLQRFLASGGQANEGIQLFLSQANVQWIHAELMRRATESQGWILADPGELMHPTEMPSFVILINTTMLIVAGTQISNDPNQMNEAALETLLPRYVERIVAKRLYRRRLVPLSQHILPRPIQDRVSRNQDVMNRRERNLHRIWPQTYRDVRKLMQY